MDVRSYLKLYFIMGSNNSYANPMEVLDQALQGGVTLFQFREKGKGAKTGKEKYELAKQMKELCDKHQVPFIVNDDIELALAVKASGVHIGQEDEPFEKARERCPANFMIGVSATNQREALQAATDGADYIGVGPIFATNTKEDAKTPIGLEGISEIKQLTKATPMVAIGGIKKESVTSILEAGADGVSLISAISQAKKPEQAAWALRNVIDTYFSF